MKHWLIANFTDLIKQYIANNFCTFYDSFTIFDKL